MLHRIAVKGVVLSFIAWAWILPLQAQDVSKIDIFAGYSFLRSQTSEEIFVPSSNEPRKLQPVDGVNISATENLNKWVGMTEDVSGYYSDAGVKNHSLLVGPQLSFRQAHGITPFIHGLFGVNYQAPARQAVISHIVVAPPIIGPGFTQTSFISTSSSILPLRGNHTAFAMAFGGGVDYNVNPRFSVRLIQADYFRNSFKFTNQLVEQICDGVGNCSTGPVFNSTAEKRNHLRLSFGVVFHL